MRPSLGRIVIYTRAPGEEYAASITWVEAADSFSSDAQPALDDENTYRVFLRVDLHYGGAIGPTREHGRSWFTGMPIAFDGRPEPAANTWRWPPRV